MTDVPLDAVSPVGDGSADGRASEEQGVVNPLAFASVALSAVGFLTLLRLADRRDRSPFAALGLFFATTLESTGGAVLGLVAAGRARDAGDVGKGFLVAAAGAVLGVVTTLLNVNWMRTRRRI
jgi:mannose/fructose/N-acetylgalactosamine-specific phosphotransferase system component IIC